jgi:hypothetical protein
MICPLRHTETTNPTTGRPFQADKECAKHECAWWDEVRGCCAVLGISAEIDSLKELLRRQPGR